MTTFNSLPLTEQLKALEPGDELHLRGGGWLPFLKYKGQMNIYTAHYVWYLEDAETDIIRVIRPSARKVPEVAANIRRLMEKLDETNQMDIGKRTAILGAAILEIADHLESEAKP